MIEILGQDWDGLSFKDRPFFSFIFTLILTHWRYVTMEKKNQNLMLGAIALIIGAVVVYYFMQSLNPLNAIQKGLNDAQKGLAQAGGIINKNLSDLGSGLKDDFADASKQFNDAKKIIAQTGGTLKW